MLPIFIYGYLYEYGLRWLWYHGREYMGVLIKVQRRISSLLWRIDFLTSQHNPIRLRFLVKLSSTTCTIGVLCTVPGSRVTKYKIYSSMYFWIHSDPPVAFGAKTDEESYHVLVV
jgi:hypothetical protein